MKNVQISHELFMTLTKYFFFEQKNLLPEIQRELEQKLDALIARELYTTYKTAPTEKEKEKARQEYLNKKGIHSSFRW